MKQWKRLTALLLSAACLCALAAVPPASAAGAVSTFPDVTDAQVGRAVEALRMMGVISGDGGKFKPQDNLTRAQFCKMAIVLMGKKDEADAQANRTIFTDVPGSHWARGYVNLAATTTVGSGEDGKGGSRLMMGQGDGTFAPDRDITYGEAVTTLLRILGYAKQANANWPQGAVDTAKAVGLTTGFSAPGANSTITRAQAALLFCNMLTAPMSGSKQTYAQAELGIVRENMLLVSNSVRTDNGLDAVQLFSLSDESSSGKLDPCLCAVSAPAAFLQGSRGTAVYKQVGQDELLLTFLPESGSVSKTITVASAANGVLTATDGTRVTPSNKAKVWNGTTPSDYASAYTSLRPGTSITVCYDAAGLAIYLFVHGTPVSLSGGAMVARDKVSGNPFAELTAGTTDYKIVKNGVAASLSDLKQYDVAAFDPTNKTLYVTDFRVTGIYESAYPNTTMPTSIKVFGKDFEVLDSAVNDLKGLKLNSGVTLLLSPEGKVAGAVSSSTLRSNMVGWVEGGSESVKVHLLNAPNSDLSTVEGSFSGKVDSYRDCLVTVTGTRSGTTNSVSLSRLTGRTPTGALNLNSRTLGDAPLADNLAVFDRIANSGIKQVSLSDIAMTSVPAAKIAYQRTNDAGKVDLIVLDDVTGDLYTYGIAKNDHTEEQSFGEGDNKTTFSNRTTSVLTSEKPTMKDNPLTVVGGTTYKDGQFIGLAESIATAELDGYHRAAASVALKSVEKVTPNNFNLSTGLFFSGSVELPIWEGDLVDGAWSGGVQCYNAQTKTWFSDAKKSPMELLRDCLAYSSDLTVYYDRDPAQGGKVRVVVAH